MNEVVLRDLQSVLRQYLKEEIIVEHFSTKSLLPPGENYGSTILAVEAIIKKNKSAAEETLYLIAKMLPPTKYQREVFDSSFTFKKETFLYEKILPSYKRLELEFGVDVSEVFDIGPKFYGTRLSSNSEVDVDDDAVILLENLKVLGYYTGDRKFGLDLEHARVAIRALARFHALGMVVKYKRPDDFEVLKLHSKCLDFNPQNFQDLKETMLNDFRTDTVISKYYSRIEPLLQMGTEIWTETPQEPWSTIIHSDFWVNNMMFHKNSNGKVDDIKFVDFQNYLFQCPVNELVFFIGASVNIDQIPENLESLLDLYYESFISILQRMDCDVTLFNREKFDETVKNAAKKEFSHCSFMLKILTIDVEKDGVDPNKLNSMEFPTGNKLFYDRLRKLVTLFVEKDWI